MDYNLRYSLGLYNPNHGAAMVCALIPMCWGWTRCVWFSRILIVLLCIMLAFTQSRTGIIVLVLEMSAWWILKLRSCRSGVLKHWMWYASGIFIAWFMLFWIAPRLSLDDSILNRPRIWLAGLQLFSANLSGVGLGNSGAIASAFLLPDIPEIRTLISAHITLLAEFGFLVGFVWFVFIILAVLGLRESPRIGIALLSLVISACASTIFDWSVLFDAVEYGDLGISNWILSWIMFAAFLLCGLWLIVKQICVRKYVFMRDVAIAVLSVGMLVCAAWAIPSHNAPKVEAGFVFRGETPRTLILYDDEWKLRTALQQDEGAVVLPVKSVLRYPANIDMSNVSRVVLLGKCQEWRHLVGDIATICSE